MDLQITRITNYAKLLNPSLSDLSNELLNFIVVDVVNRAIVYMNRHDLVENQQLPTILERVLAGAITSTYKTIQATNSNDTPIKSLEDNGQKIEYGEAVATLFTQTADETIFASCITQLNQFRYPTVYKDDCSI